MEYAHVAVMSPVENKAARDKRLNLQKSVIDPIEINT